jgi:hydrogenase-4 component F
VALQGLAAIAFFWHWQEPPARMPLLNSTCLGFLLLGLAVTFAALFRKVQSMVSGEIPAYQKRLKVAHVPVLLHMSLVLLLGLYMPKFLAEWFHTAVELLK